MQSNAKNLNRHQAISIISEKIWRVIVIIQSPVREKRRGIRSFCERVRRNARRVRASGTKRIVKRRVWDRGKRKIPRVILATCVNVKRWHTPRGWRWFNNIHDRPTGANAIINGVTYMSASADTTRDGVMWLLSLQSLRGKIREECGRRCVRDRIRTERIQGWLPASPTHREFSWKNISVVDRVT